MTNIKNAINHADLPLPEEISMQTSALTRNITVEVSGSRFCIVPSLFKCIENLRWKKQKSHSHNKITLKLNANPDVFESVLQFFLSSKLPDPKILSSRKAKTLIDFVAPLDPIAVKPFVDYLQSFIVEKSTAKTSFMSRNFANVSSPFSSRVSRSKSKALNLTSIDRTADQNASHTSGNNNKHKNSNSHCHNRTHLGKDAPPSAVISSIPTHIEHPMTTSASIAEISACSLDESSSVSKLSLQPSPSLGMTLLTGPQNENSMSASSSSSSSSSSAAAAAAVSALHQIHRFQNQYKHYYQQNALKLEESNTEMDEQRCTQDSGFSVGDHVHRESLSATSIGYKSDFPKMLESSKRITNKVSSEQCRQYHPQTIIKANDCVPFTQTHNFMTDVNCDSDKKICTDIHNNSNSHELHTTTKIIHRVLVGNEKKYIGTDKDSSRKFYRKQKRMTHADWCASEYVV